MFTAAINEPFETNNGLIKILPHAKIEIAHNNSINRAAGAHANSKS